LAEVLTRSFFSEHTLYYFYSLKIAKVFSYFDAILILYTSLRYKYE